MEFTKQIATPTFIWGTECHSWKITDFYLDLGRVSFDLCLYNFCVSLGKSFNLSEYQIPYLLNECFTELWESNEIF